jgi:hypothetical protein
MNRLEQIKGHRVCPTRQIVDWPVGHVAFHVRGIARALHARRWETMEVLP